MKNLEAHRKNIEALLADASAPEVAETLEGQAILTKATICLRVIDQYAAAQNKSAAVVADMNRQLEEAAKNPPPSE